MLNQTQPLIHQLQPKQGEKKRAGRPPNRRTNLPFGHVDVEGLARIFGLAQSTLRGLIMRGDPRIPPRSPLAGSGKNRRQIWRKVDVAAHLGMSLEEIDAALAWGHEPSPAAHEPKLTLPPAFFQPAQPTTVAQQAPQTKQKKPGRPRGSGSAAALHIHS